MVTIILNKRPYLSYLSILLKFDQFLFLLSQSIVHLKNAHPLIYHVKYIISQQEPFSSTFNFFSFDYNIMMKPAQVAIFVSQNEMCSHESLQFEFDYNIIQL